MLTAIVLRDDELSQLSRTEQLGLEFLLHDRLSEVARGRRSGDSALLLAIKAADYLAPLYDELDDDAVADLLTDVAASGPGRAALARAAQVAAITASNAA